MTTRSRVEGSREETSGRPARRESDQSETIMERASRDRVGSAALRATADTVSVVSPSDASCREGPAVCIDCSVLRPLVKNR